MKRREELPRKKANFMPVRPRNAEDGRTAGVAAIPATERECSSPPAYFLPPFPIPTLVMRQGSSELRPFVRPTDRPTVRVRDPRLALILRARSTYLELNLRI